MGWSPSLQEGNQTGSMPVSSTERPLRRGDKNRVRVRPSAETAVSFGLIFQTEESMLSTRLNLNRYFVNLFIIISFIILVICGIVGIETNLCEAKFKNSGHAVHYDTWVGCMVEAQPGVWVPEKNFIIR